MHWIEGIVQGVLLGGLYAQYALGMALMFGVMKIVNVTHGDLVILLALIGISFADFAGIGPWSVLVTLVPIGAAIGWLLQRAILNRVVGDDPCPRSSPPLACRLRCRMPCWSSGRLTRALCPAAGFNRRRSRSGRSSWACCR